MVLIDASTRWSHVFLLSNRDSAFARFLAQIIRLRAQFTNFPIKKIRFDNFGNLHLNFLIIIACLLEFMLNILLYTLIHKMV